MENWEVLKQLASFLNWRRQQGGWPYHLLLTADVAFTREVCQEVCGSPDWQVFQDYMQSLGRGERVEVLAHFLRQHQALAGYQALARLVQAGYFSTIFLASPDSFLEEHLAALNCRADVWVVGGHSDEAVLTFLEKQPRAPCLVKLHGCLKEGLLPPTFPHPSVLPTALRHTLQRYLNQDIVVVGSLSRDQDIARLFTSRHANNLYYVVPAEPDRYDEVRRTIEARGSNPDTHLLTGDLGTCEAFFPALEAELALKQGPTTLQRSTGHSLHPRFADQSALADVLLVTVTQVETDAVLELFPRARLLHDPLQTYYDLGRVAHARVFLVRQPTMGAGEPGGSLLTIYKAIQALAPTTVIMSGIAFGFDPHKFKIGDILVSEQIQTYESQRVSNGFQQEPVFISRGPCVPVSPRLLGRFKNTIRGWSGQSVAFGTILSGNKLIDNSVYRDQVRSFAPEALGGEMEGEGLYAATQDHAHRVDWILVKAISDWADGNKALNKEQHQQLAARNAAQFVVHVLRQGGFSSE
jgi:nucleoside phosphorylase